MVAESSGSESLAKTSLGAAPVTVIVPSSETEFVSLTATGSSLTPVSVIVIVAVS